MLIDVFLKIQQKFSDWDLKIIGAGEEYTNLFNKIDNNPKIKLIKPTINLQHYYANSSIFVVSSDFESFSLVTAEALYYKLPVIGFDNCVGLRDMVINGVNGYLVDSKGDKNFNLYTQLYNLILNDNYKNFSTNNDNIISNYSINNIIKEWIILINKF